VTSLLIAQASDPPAPARDLKPYEALKLKAGKDPQAQVKLALWCEAHGLNAERLQHLARAEPLGVGPAVQNLQGG
jgi:hypothetical protein